MIDKLNTTVGRKGLLAIAGLVVVALVIAVWAPRLSASGGGLEKVSLEGTEWTLVSLGGIDVLTDSEITALFSEEKIGGSAGCNSYFAGYKVDGDSLAFGPVGSTMMMGPEPLMQQEMAYLSALGTAESFSIAGGVLEIVYDGGILAFIAE